MPERVLVDTPIWSLGLRRDQDRLNPVERQHVAELDRLLVQERVRIIGPIRQELLSGARSHEHFLQLRDKLRILDDKLLFQSDFEFAAALQNVCRRAGVQGSPTDFVICAVAIRLSWPVFTLDRDFIHYSRTVSVPLHHSSPW